MKDFDTSRNSLIDRDEFFNGISRWLHRVVRRRPASGDAGTHATNSLNAFNKVS